MLPTLYQDECVLWETGISDRGYATIVDITGKTRLAHRYVFELCNGDIPKGMVVKHSCDKKNCINPDHLEIGTQAENVQEAYDRGLAKQSRRFDDSTVRYIRKSQLPYRELADMFEVALGTIQQIKERKTYKNVE